MKNDLLPIILCIAAIMIIIFLVLNIRKSEKSGFDERQQLVRGRAYQAGFFTMLGSTLLLAIFFDEQTIFTLSGGVGACMSAGLLAFGLVSVFGDAFTQVRENNSRALLITFCGLITLLGGVMNVSSGEALSNGRLDTMSIPLFIGAAVLLIGLTQFIRLLVLRRSGDADND